MPPPPQASRLQFTLDAERQAELEKQAQEMMQVGGRHLRCDMRLCCVSVYVGVNVCMHMACLILRGPRPKPQSTTTPSGEPSHLRALEVNSKLSTWK